MVNQIMLWQAMIVGWVRDHVPGKDDTWRQPGRVRPVARFDRRRGYWGADFPRHSVSSTLNNVANAINNP